ncbi:hypothetical protein D3C72_2277670 [compost metagenome]
MVAKVLAAQRERQIRARLVGQHAVDAPPGSTVETRSGDDVHGLGLAVAGLSAVDQLGAHRPLLVKGVPTIERVLLAKLTVG